MLLRDFRSLALLALLALLAAAGCGAHAAHVTVTTLPVSYRLQVQASGLRPGSAHSVHLHLGNCPSTGIHISVLGTLVADGSGAGSLTVTVGRPYAGNGRFVIVYTGPAPGPLAA